MQLTSSPVLLPNRENECCVSHARDYARRSYRVTTLGVRRRCDVRYVYAERVFREYSAEREREIGEAAGARCGALMTGNRQYELDGSVPHRVPQ